jgi:hypothetical protein
VHVQLIILITNYISVYPVSWHFINSDMSHQISYQLGFSFDSLSHTFYKEGGVNTRNRKRRMLELQYGDHFVTPEGWCQTLAMMLIRWAVYMIAITLRKQHTGITFVSMGHIIISVGHHPDLLHNDACLGEKQHISTI